MKLLISPNRWLHYFGLAVISCICLISPRLFAQDAPKIEIFGGYSYLKTDDDFGDEGLSGWEASGIYFLNSHWGIGIDISGHYKSTNDLKFNLYIYQAEVIYNLVKNQNPKNKFFFTPFLNGGAGIASYHSEVTIPGFPKFESEETSFAATLGGGVDLSWGKKLAIRLFQADYVLTNFNNESQSNFRASTGLVLRLGSVE